MGKLEEHLAAALARGDHERAAQLRDEMQRQGSKIRIQVPGRMGLGTSDQVMQPPTGWTAPKKPDLMTTRVKGRKR